MKFKKNAIKKDMVIRCQTSEEAEALMKYIEGTKYGSVVSLRKVYEDYYMNKDIVFHIIHPEFYITIDEYREYKEWDFEITEFSDLIEPDLVNEPENKLVNMRFKENAIKPGMVIHCLTIDEARTLSEHLTSMCAHNAKVILDFYGKTEGKYPIDCIEINRSAGSGLYVTCSSRKWYEQEVKRPITEFSDLIELEKDERGQKLLREVFGLEKKEGSVDGEKAAEMSAVEVLEWLAEADKETLHIVFDYDNILDLLENVNAEQIVKDITAYEAAKKEQKPSLDNGEDKNAVDLQRELLVDGAYKKVSSIVASFGMEDWLEPRRKILIQSMSPYLPSNFFRQFAGREPSKKELLCANMENFSDSISSIRVELAAMFSPSYIRQADSTLGKIYALLQEEIGKIREEIVREEAERVDAEIQEDGLEM